MRIELNIEELVLVGFPAEDRARIARAFEHELERLLSDEQHSTPESAEIPRLDLSALTIREYSPAGVGAQVARSLHEGLFR